MRLDNNKNELLFKNIASSYVKKAGDELLNELDTLNSQADCSSLDIKLKSRMRKNKTDTVIKWSTRLLPLAACFVLIFTFISAFLRNNHKDIAESDLPSSVFTFEFVSAKLPENYTLQKVDYDYEKAIYHISSDDANKIILTVEEFTDDIPADGMEQIKINDINAYKKTDDEYSLLKYKKDNVLYTLTCPDNYDDLIVISKTLI